MIESNINLLMIVRIIQDLRKPMEKMQEMFAKDLQELKNKQTEMNNTLEGISSRIPEAEEWINHQEDRMMEITPTKLNIRKRVNPGWGESLCAHTSSAV